MSISLEWVLELELIYSIRFKELFFNCCTKYISFYFHPYVHYFILNVAVSFLNIGLERWSVFLICARACITILQCPAIWVIYVIDGVGL